MKARNAGLHLLWAVSLAAFTSAWGLGPDQLVFNLGAVLPANPRAREVDLGYRLLEKFRVANTWKITWKDGSQTKVYFRYESQNSQGLEEHEGVVRDLLQSGKVDFLLGSVDDFSRVEANVAVSLNKMSFQCCSSLGNHRPYRGVYWLGPQEKHFVDPVIRSILLQGIKKVAIVYDAEDVVTQSCATTLHNVLEEFEDVDYQTELTKTLAYNSSNEIERFPDFVTQFRRNHVEAVVACCLESSCGNLLNSIHEQRYPLKSLYLMEGPSDREWVEKFPLTYTRDVVSTTPWSVKARIKGELFGFMWKYRVFHKQFYNITEEPGYDSASAFSAGIVVLSGIKSAFSSCNFTSEDTAESAGFLDDPAALSCDDGLEKSGYERIQAALTDMDIVTPIGNVVFDRKLKNRKSNYITTQVRQRSTELEDGFSVDVVLPIQYATAQMKIPASNPYLETCQPGQYVTSDEFARCADCRPGEVSTRLDADHCDRCSFTEYMSETGQQVCNQCPKGTKVLERAATNLTDCICMENYYQPDSKPGMECFPCMEGADCPGGLELPIPMKGYWSSAVARQFVYDCTPESSCEGGQELKCAQGYGGRLCSACVDGHFHLLNKCWACPSSMRLIGLIVLIVVVWYFLNIVVSKNFETFDMVLAFAQLGNIIGDVDLNWPSKLVRVFDVTNILDFDVDVLEPTCFFKDWGFAQNLYVQLSLPLLMGLMASSGFLISWIMMQISMLVKPSKRSRDPQDGWLSFVFTIPDSKEKLDEKWDGTIAAFLSAIDVTFVTMSKYCLDAFQCEMIGNRRVLRSSPGLECGTRDHTIVKIFAALGILAYVVFYMCFVCWKLMSMWRSKTFADRRNLRRFGNYYRCYEPDYFWMSTVYMARRLVFVMVIIFIKNPAFQAGALTSITNASLMLHVYTAPYVSTQLDVLFSILLVALIFQTFGGLMFYTEKLSSTEKDLLEWLVIIAIVALVLAFIVLFIHEVRHMYRVHVLRRMYQKVMFLGSDSSHRYHGSLGSSSRDTKLSFELLKTFNPHFLYKGLSRSKSNLEQWNRFTLMLKDYVSDQSETSYLSTHNIAKFWRDLVARFPEIVDYLALTDSTGRHHFAEFANKLYINHYLSKQVEKIQIFKVLNWRDRAPLAQWLAHCSDEDRDFFTGFMGDMFRTVKGEEKFKIYKQKVVSRGEAFPDLLVNVSKEGSKKEGLSGAVAKVLVLKKGLSHFRHKLAPDGKIAIRDEIRLARGPFFHCASHGSPDGPSLGHGWSRNLQVVRNETNMQKDTKDVLVELPADELSEGVS